MAVPQSALEQEKKAEQAIAALEAKQQHDRNPPKIEANNTPPEAQVQPVAELSDQSIAAAAEEIINESNDDLISLQEQLNRERQLRKTLEGRIRSQLKPANEEIRSLRSQLAETQERIQKIEAESKKPGAQRFLNEEEIESLGDVLEVNTRMVKGILEEALEAGEIKAHIESLVQKSTEIREEQDPVGPADDFWPLVDQYCPGSREINRRSDPKWIEFLDQYNTQTGILNRELAETAMQYNDPAALADLFFDFKRKNGDIGGDSTKQNNRPAPRPESGNQQSMSVNQAPNVPEKFSQAQVKAFYNDLARGRFRGREAEAKAIEERIMVAAETGRIY